MLKNPLTEKGLLTAAALSLFWLGHARAQTIDGTQIIGYNDSSSVYNIENLDTSDFTTFIVGFIMPGGTPTAPNLTFDSAEDSTYANELSASFVQGINTTEAAGKNVLLSFGGADATNAAYAAFGDNATDTATLAGILTAYVNGASTYTDGNGMSHPITTYAGSTHFNGFSGIDLDYEDSGSFSSGNTFSGVTFLQNLTVDLRNDLGSKIITQAPQTPYLNTSYAQNNSGAYQAVLESGSSPTAAGSATTWLNVQFYSNPSYDGNSDPDGVVAAFKTLVQDNPGIPTSKLVLTLPMYNLGTDNTFTNSQIQYIITQINSYLKGLGDGAIAGVAGFQLYNPAYGNDTSTTPTALDSYNAAFASSIAQVASVPEPSSYVLLGVGALGLVWLMRRRQAAGC